jgi:hypothetical protein
MEIKMKTTMRYKLICTTMTIIKKTRVAEDREKLKPS